MLEQSYPVYSIHIKRPILPERYAHFFGFFLDVMLPRKPLTTFFLEYSTAMAVGTLSAAQWRPGETQMSSENVPEH